MIIRDDKDKLKSKSVSFSLLHFDINTKIRVIGGSPTNFICSAINNMDLKKILRRGIKGDYI